MRTVRLFVILAAIISRAIAMLAGSSSAILYCSRRKRTLPWVKPVTAARNFPCGVQKETEIPAFAQAPISPGDIPMSHPMVTMPERLISGRRRATSPSSLTQTVSPSLKSHAPSLVINRVFRWCFIVLDHQ